MWCAGCGASSVVADYSHSIEHAKGNVFSSFEVLIVLVMTECLERGVHDAGWIH